MYGANLPCRVMRPSVMTAPRWTALRRGAAGSANTMPLLVDAVRAYATIGEMCDALRVVWGEYVEDAVI